MKSGNDSSGAFPMLMYGLQWWIISIPCVVIMGVIIAKLHFTSDADQIFYMQKLFALMGIGMTVQVLWGYRLPLIIGPASVLLIGILATMSVGVGAIYTSIMVGGAMLAILAFAGYFHFTYHYSHFVSDCFHLVFGHYSELAACGVMDGKRKDNLKTEIPI